MVYYTVQMKSHKKLVAKMLLSIIYLSLVSSVISAREIIQPKVKSRSNIQFIETNTTVFTILLDETKASKEQGDMFVGARNFIYRVSPSLTITDLLQNGPHNDSALCLSSPSTTGNLSPNDNRVLIVDIPRQNEFIPQLLSCGTNSHGMCYIISPRNFNAFGSSHCFGSPNDTINFVASKSNTLAFQIKSTGSSGSFVIGYEHDHRPVHQSPPPLSVRKVILNPLSFHYYNNDGHNSTIELKPQLKESYRIIYQYGFHDDDFYYIISNQKVGLNSLDYEARIARVCINDTSMTTYTESPIRCRTSFNREDDADAIAFNVVTTAHYGKAGEKLSRLLNATPVDDLLYLAFAATRASRGYTINQEHGSAICAVSLRELNQHFDKITVDCFNGSDDVILHPAFFNSWSSHSDEGTCTSYNGTFESCAHRSSHAYILAQDHPTLRPVILLPQDNITSLTVFPVGNATTAIIGTQKGEIIKSSLDSPTEELFRQNFLPDNFSLTQDTQVRRNPAVDKVKNVAYFAVGTSIVKFPLDSCSIYQKCSQCISSNDPLGCIWCGNKCSTKNECVTGSTDTCNPVIYSFHPKNGPIEGATEITIIGDNFGHPQSGAPADVTIVAPSHFVQCAVKIHENEKIICSTKSTLEPMSGHVKVTVKKQEKNVYINYTIDGTGVSDDEFAFTRFSISKVFPLFGPRSGGVRIHIQGANLHIGSQRRVNIISDSGDVISRCEDESTSPGEIICLTGKTSTKGDPAGNVTLSIDGASMSTGVRFSFHPDPVISSVTPAGAPVTAQMKVTFSGSNFNSIPLPSLRLSCPHANLSIPCTIVTSERIQCQLPSLNQSWVNVACKLVLCNEDQVVPIDQKHQINLHPEPQLNNLSSADHVSLTDRTVTIRGVDLSDDYLINITLGHDKYPCNTIETYRDKLICKIQFPSFAPSVNDTLSVSYSIGSIEKDLGYVTFVDTKETGSSFNWLLFLIFFIIASVVAIYYWRKKSRREKTIIPHVVYRNEPSPRSNNVYLDTVERPGEASPLINPIDDESLALLRSSNKLIALEYISRGEIVGKGHFGKVYKGVLETPDHDEKIDVAIKTLQHLTNESTESFVREALIMKDFNHKNVMALIGIVFPENDAPFLVLPFMCNGDLLQYVRDDNRAPRIRELLKFSLDVAKGMEYLSSQKFVHRDLAARNCMLDQNLNVCVADFGLSRDVYEKGYYNPESKATPLPFKWMAPESLKMFTFTTKSDVWSYGITSWELITRGLVPYAGVNNNELDKYLESGARLYKPEFCPETIYNLWRRCWSYNPIDRPTFVDIVAEIECFISLVNEKALQVTVPTDALYRNISNGRYYNETSDANEPAQACSSRQPVTEISKQPADLPSCEATSL